MHRLPKKSTKSKLLRSVMDGVETDEEIFALVDELKLASEDTIEYVINETIAKRHTEDAILEELNKATDDEKTKCVKGYVVFNPQGFAHRILDVVDSHDNHMARFAVNVNVKRTGKLFGKLSAEEMKKTLECRVTNTQHNSLLPKDIMLAQYSIITRNRDIVD
ncbi:hypothetical protein [Methylocystis iwaonis]|uniref:hypothetical protein n=1 Tax=Methylocystis iwaonis TaxID=2885079 RepID=UPI002E7B4375|nr:hypothetical protein [Methylocystis iwaonis]